MAIDGIGYVKSVNDYFSFDELEYPDDEMVNGLNKALELKEFESLKNIIKLFRVNFKPVKFVGQALMYNRTDVPECTYAICISGCINEMQWNSEYINWVYKHELRHCRATISENIKSPFRFHDVLLKDIGNGNMVGFFFEDFKDIACCDKLMMAFRNVDGIEEYLFHHRKDK